MRVGLVSLDQRWEDKRGNFRRCEALIEEAAANGCTLAVFPEMTLTGYSLNPQIVAESAAKPESLRWFGELAKTSGVHLVFGACLVGAPALKPRNVLCHAAPEGDGATECYAKVHPFTFAGEDQVFEGGSALGFVELNGVRLGASICYDLRFPELYAAMAPESDGAICIANWPGARIAHWRALLVARAIENQMYMIAVNRIGIDGSGLEYPKSSMVVSPDGEVMVPVRSSAELDLYDVDWASTRRYRDAFPTLRDKRPLADASS